MKPTRQKPLLLRDPHEVSASPMFRDDALHGRGWPFVHITYDMWDDPNGLMYKMETLQVVGFDCRDDDGCTSS